VICTFGCSRLKKSPCLAGLLELCSFPVPSPTSLLWRPLHRVLPLLCISRQCVLSLMWCHAPPPPYAYAMLLPPDLAPPTIRSLSYCCRSLPFFPSLCSCKLGLHTSSNQLPLTCTSPSLPHLDRGWCR
jgi:hypothetical protein